MLVCPGGSAGVKQETDKYWLPAKEVRSEQETPGDLQQETAGLCTGKLGSGQKLSAGCLDFV